MPEPTIINARKPSLWWNQPWTLVEGCTRCSAGCKDCWALALEKRTGRAVEGGGIRLRPDRLNDPVHWRKPRVVAVWNDLCHEDVPEDFVHEVFQRVCFAMQHTYIILTKRPSRFREYFGGVNLPAMFPNVILGVTCESNKYRWRVEELIKTSAAVRFVNAHLLGPLNLDICIEGIPWAGGSAKGGRDYSWLPGMLHWLAIECNRPFRGEPAEWWGWCRSLIEQADAAGMAVWVKQGPREDGSVTHDLAQFPPWARARRREFPATKGDDDEQG